jgi:D-alanyl-D-alanine carboxypeptidase/D-alanyl-D-alanine-endopeptidase (penicillin-binding protein 4)
MPRLTALALAFSSLAIAQMPADFDARVKAIMARPEYRHSRFGMEFYSLDQGKVLYALHPQELFIPASTTKLVTVGSALELLGPDFQFHTRVYRAGPIEGDTLHGDLVLVASGDPDLSNRIQPDGTLAFENEDHTYDGFSAAKPVPGDPLIVLRQLAAQVLAAGVKHIEGHVRVDASLFPEGKRELGTHTAISPMVINDNVVDVTVTPSREGDAPILTISPLTRYVAIRNEVKTVAAGGETVLKWNHDTQNADGTHSVTLSGTIPITSKPRLRAYRVPSPSRFAEMAFAQVLATAGIRIGGRDMPVDRVYTSENQLAEHVSPPLREETKVILKVSQNLHASMLPYIVGAVLDKEKLDKQKDDAEEAGFRREAEVLKKADLDLSGAAQSDGAGGAALFAPDFMVQYLLHLTRQPFFPDFLKGLPILGKDGTLFDIQKDSPAAGHVFAKTGTFGADNALSGGGVVTAKGLAGFIDTKDGHRLVFAAYINFVPFAEMNEDSTQKVGQALGEIAAAAASAEF